MPVRTNNARGGDAGGVKAGLRGRRCPLFTINCSSATRKPTCDEPSSAASAVQKRVRSCATPWVRCVCRLSRYRTATKTRQSTALQLTISTEIVAECLASANKNASQKKLASGGDGARRGGQPLPTRVQSRPRSQVHSSAPRPSIEQREDLQHNWKI